MTLRQWAKTPKGYVVMALVAFLLIASIGSKDMKGMINGLIAVGVSITVDIACSLVKKRKRVIPDSAIITGLIIALILGTTSSWIIVAATSILSILSKHLLVYRNKPIFNPAAIGLLLSILIFGSGQSWWGAFADLPAWTLAFVVIGGYAVTNRVNKFPLFFSFLAMFLVLLFMMGRFNIGDASDALRPPFINAALFFALFMLTDPPTTPAKMKDQLIFGLLAAVVSIVVYGLFEGLMYLFIGLLVGNLYHMLNKIKRSPIV